MVEAGRGVGKNLKLLREGRYGLVRQLVPASRVGVVAVSQDVRSRKLLGKEIAEPRCAVGRRPRLLGVSV